MHALDGYTRPEYEDATEATTQYDPMLHVSPCKIEGCENAKADKAGIYGGLCQFHKDEKKKDRAAASSAPVVPPVTKSELAELALAIDVLLAEIEEKRKRLEVLLATFDETVQERLVPA